VPRWTADWVKVRRKVAKATGRAYDRRRVSSDGIDESDRSEPAYQNVLERNPGGGVGSGPGCS
jgi:hypothetical protein